MIYTKPLLAPLGLALALGVFAPTALADSYKVEHPRARPSLGVAKNTAAFFTIHNKTGQADKLLSASSDVAKKVQLHTHLKENGVFKMRPVKFIDIPANGRAELKSGGFHVMIIGVHSKLKVGDMFKLKLYFEHAAPMTIMVPVLKIGAMKMKDMKKAAE